jgi:hypothetical protein
MGTACICQWLYLSVGGVVFVGDHCSEVLSRQVEGTVSNVLANVVDFYSDTDPVLHGNRTTELGSSCIKMCYK